MVRDSFVMQCSRVPPLVICVRGCAMVLDRASMCDCSAHGALCSRASFF